MTSRSPLPLSPEFIAHHAGLHPCDDADMVEVVCPCGDAVALSCSACGQAVFFSTRPVRGASTPDGFGELAR